MWLLAVLTVASACENERRAGPTLGSACTLGAPCVNSVCSVDLGLNSETGICILLCTTDSECDEGFCAATPSGAQVCVDSCTVYGTYACVDDRPLHCSLTGGSACSTCGCSEGEVCNFDTDTCQPPSDVGGPCRRDDQCSSGNCSTWAGVCRVPVGQYCTTSNCDVCLRGSAWAFCSRRCNSEDSDPDCNGFQCLGLPSVGDYTCRPRCASLNDPSCPGQRCEYDADFRELYCDCMEGACRPAAATRPEGEWCSADADCTEGHCFRTSAGPGWCARPGCPECAAGTECVDIPCSGVAGECGMRCIPTCDEQGDCARGNTDGFEIGACRLVNGPSGRRTVCDPHLADGANCTSDPQCQSSSCVDGRCVSLGSQPSGAACDSARDCMSGVCSAEVCQGSALLGDTCAVPADCVAGRCCDGVCSNDC